ncbi:hypothetical protein ABZP36_032105 [Zizania latifolia]
MLKAFGNSSGQYKMSLHVGRLAPDVRQEYLEHLFQRFGNCTVKVKDGYGFAVFDSNDDASRAMLALRGKYVCGERITVNWSKQQPRFSKDLRSSRIIESSYRRTSRDGDFRFRDSLAQKNHPASHDQGHSPDDAPEKKSDDVVEVLTDVKETIGEDLVEMKRNEDGTSDANAIEHDRWNETGKGNPDGDGDDFDNYEPYHGYIRQEEKEKVVRASSHETCHHIPFDLNHDKSKSPPACYNCGAAGHIARDCSWETDGRFRAWRDVLSLREKRDLRLRRFGSPLRRPPEFHVDPVAQTHHTIQDGRKQFSDRTRWPHRLSNVSREDKRDTPRSEGIPQAPKYSRKRVRSKRSRDSSLSSDRTTSYSRTRSSHSCSHSHSCSRAHSPSHSAHSSSKSSQPTQPEGLRSMAISNVSYPSPLLVSVSPQHNSPSAAESKKLDVLANSHLEGNLDFKRTGLKHMHDYKQDIKNSRLNGEAPVIPFKLKIRGNGESPVSDQDANVAGYTETNMDKNLVHSSANGVQGQKTNSEDPSSVKSNKDVLAKTGRSNSLKLATNEVVCALKHYGMEAHNTDLLNQPVEKYFGAARLWPWEVIYFRRLKKGPISTENYAKRLEQNKEYGIVDQYVRSSSGWWESN